jgi:hypothetical protein
MQFFPRDRYRFTRLQVLHAARYFLVPSRLHGFLRLFGAVEQDVGQCRSLVDRERECPLRQIENFWTHRVILPVDFGCRYLFRACVERLSRFCFTGSILKDRQDPPPPGSFGITGLAGNSWQNPEPKEVRGQNLGGKRVTATLHAVISTACAGAMMKEFRMRRKVRCHKGAVENYWGSKPLEVGVAESHPSQSARGMGHPASSSFVLSGFSARFGVKFILDNN